MFPILPGPIAEEVLARLPDSISSLRRLVAATHPAAEYSSFGTVVPEAQITEIGLLLRTTAGHHGYPDEVRGQPLIRFDQEVAGPLHVALPLSPWLAADEGVWAFMTLIVAPDVAVWRYRQRHPDRLLGGPRNVFRRLWWRAELLGDGPEDAPAVMGEDQLVGVMERTDAIGADPRIARAFCSAVIHAQRELPDVSPTLLQREASKWITRTTPLRVLGGLDDGELREVVTEAVRAAVSGLTAAR